MFVVLYWEKFGCVILLVFCEFVILGKYCDICDCVFLVGEVIVVSEVFVENVELVFYFYGEVVDGVFDFVGSIGVEVVKIVVKIWCVFYLLE